MSHAKLDWRELPLKHLATLNPEVLTEATQPDYQLAYVDIGSVTLENGIETIEEMGFAAAPSRARRRVRDGDTIVSTVRTYLRAIAPIVNPPENLIVSTGFAVVRPRGDVDPRFLSYALRSSRFVEAVVAESVGVSYPAIAPTKLGCIGIWVGPLVEQRAIADFLDSETAKIDAMIAKQEELIERIEEKRVATITQSVTGASAEIQSYDTGIRWIGSIPRHWKVMKLRHLTRQIVDGAHFTPTYVDEGVPFLRVTDIHKSCIDWRDVKRIPVEEHIDLTKRCKPQRGDVLLSKNGTIGVPFVVNFDEDFSIFVSLCLIKLSPKLNPNFLAYFIMSNSFKEQISHGIKQSTVTNLHLDKIAQFDIVVPPVDEQVSICSQLKDELEEIEALSAKSIQFRQTLIEHRSALISAAVTGQIEVGAKAAAVIAA